MKLLLAHRWNPSIDPTGYWLSEKLDGVRAYWDGTGLFSRLGKKLFAPPWFVEGLPREVHLDGELFAGRKMFHKTVSAVRQRERAHGWRELLYVVFDAPKLDAPFEDRLNVLGERVSGVHVVVHQHWVCRGLVHLEEELARIEALGGEGLMMRKPGSRYERGRSMTLLKVKTFRHGEAVVVGHLPGRAGDARRIGSLACVLPNGTRFSVGSGLTDHLRENPPPIGAAIHFRYQEETREGVPRFPTFVGVRALPPP